MSSASLTPVERGAVEPFDPIRISPSRVNAYLQCGEAFERKYVKGERPKVIGSAALFGNVMHGAAEKWALDRSQDFVKLAAESWLELAKGTPVSKFIERYQSLSVEAMKAEAAARKAWEADPRNKGKTSKAPRMTKHFRESKVAQDIERLLSEWVPKLNDGSPWRFTERDPLPNLYDESLILAKRYSRKWADLPPALYTEFGFTVEWRGFILRGFIDCIEPAEIDGVGYVVGDYKTYRNEAPKAKDWRQGVIYDIAFESLCESYALPFDPKAPRWVVFDYMRLLQRKDFRFNSADRDQLFRELTMYRKGVEAGVFLPAHKNTNPDFCDFPEDCCMLTRGNGTACRGGLYPEATDGEAG